MGPSYCILVSALLAVCASQRSPYAGLRPIGFPIIETTTVAATVQNDTLGNRFGENSTVTTTTQRLPVEALGDRELVNRLGKLPQDKQPFWYLNWQALEANRQRPQSYPLRPNVFVDNISFPTNDGAPEITQQPIQNNQPLLPNSQPFLNTQQPLQNNQGLPNVQQPLQNMQGFLNTQQPIQNNPSIPNAQLPVQNNQGFLNIQQPIQNNPSIPNAQLPVQNSQGFLNTQQPFQNNESFLNTQVPLQNTQAVLSNNQPPFQNNQGVLKDNQKFSSEELPEDSDEFDSEIF